MARRIRIDGHFETPWKPWPIECSMSSKNPGKSMMIFVPYIVCDKTGIHGYPEKKTVDTTRIPLVDPHRISHVVCLYVCILYIYI